MAQDPQQAEKEIDTEAARKKILDEILKNDAMCEESRKILQDPNVVFIIRRSKNRNVVVYKV